MLIEEDTNRRNVQEALSEAQRRIRKRVQESLTETQTQIRESKIRETAGHCALKAGEQIEAEIKKAAQIDR